VDLKRTFETGIEKYGSGAGAQIALSTASVILGAVFLPGAAVTAGVQILLNDHVSKIRQRRMEEARGRISEQVQQVDEEKVDKSFVESDAFFDWLADAFDKIRRTDDQAKRDALRNTFVNGLLVGQSTSPFKDIILRRLGEMSPHHVHALRVWGQVARPLQPADNLNSTSLTARQSTSPFARREEYRAALPTLTDAEFEALISDLMTMGILASWYPEGTFGAMAPMDRVGLTELGDEFVRYMTDPTA
jgi:hypothetical protein